jgi:RNA polymerase sigma-70 factor (ECF subfamily)
MFYAKHKDMVSSKIGRKHIRCPTDAQALAALDLMSRVIAGGETYQPCMVASRAHARVLWHCGFEAAARDASPRMAGLSSDPGIRRSLLAAGCQDALRR